MARLLVWLFDAVILFMIVRFVMRLFGGGQTRGPRRTPSGGAPPFQQKTPERLGGTLVRDPQCGTYIPESRAIRVKVGAETLHFCSAECRDAFQART